MNYQYRVDRVWDDIHSTYDEWKELDKCTTAFLFEHPPTKKGKAQHCHGYLFDTPSKYKTFQGNVKKAFSLIDADYETSQTCGKGDKKKSIDLSGAWMYASKGATLRAKSLKNISPQQVEELDKYARDNWVQHTEKTPETKTKTKTDYWTFLQDVREKAEKQMLYKYELDNQCELVMTVDKHKLYKLLIASMNEHKMVLEINQMTRMFATLVRDDPIHGEEIRKSVFRRLFSTD